ncbi:hypothetical protein HJFPF1_10495 [Paramyrothecium foliicola]|nr:hypothetical protein HJFPF1_10495 [Paramyrothecium foliicola]
MATEFISRYRLTRVSLKTYLEGQFPTGQVVIKEHDDDWYTVTVPNPLSDVQKAKIKAMQNVDL